MCTNWHSVREGFSLPYPNLALLQHLYVINALNGLHAFLLACNVGTIIQTNCSNIKAFDLVVQLLFHQPRKPIHLLYKPRETLLYVTSQMYIMSLCSTY